MQLDGGLGNQLFQIYAGRLYAEIHKRQLFLDLSRINRGYFQKQRRTSGLQTRGIAGLSMIQQYGQVPSYIPNIYRMNGVIARFSRLSRRIEIFDLSPSGEVGHELTFIDLESMSSNAREVRLRGNMQSTDLVNHFFNSGFEENLKPQNFSSLAGDLFFEIVNNNPIVIHCRLQDYPEGVELLKSNYYEECLAHLRSLYPTTAVWLFSDAPNLVATLKPKLFELVDKVIDQVGLSDCETIYLLSQVKMLIGANSSFSYWAARFTRGANVFFPVPWFKAYGSAKLRITMKYPESWAKITW